MIEYLIGVDGGGSGTRVRLARSDGQELAQGHGGPSGLMHGIAEAWTSVGAAVQLAFDHAGIEQPALASIAIGLGLAGVHNKQWAASFIAANPGYAVVALESDALTTLLGAHLGQPGAIVAIGTGSVGEVLYADGRRHEVGGWGFPSGDEAGGAWIGMRAMNHAQQAVDGRVETTAFAQAIIDNCGGTRDAMQVWLADATQTRFAQLAPLVLQHATSNPAAQAIAHAAGAQVALIAAAFDASLPVALCGGLAQPLMPYLPDSLLRRVVPAQGDSASGALRLVRNHLAEPAC